MNERKFMKQIDKASLRGQLTYKANVLKKPGQEYPQLKSVFKSLDACSWN